VQDYSRLLKLLETATHPTAADGERLNALNAFRRISDRAGGLNSLFGDGGSQLRTELTLAKAELEAALKENARLKVERDAMLQRRPSASKQGTAPKSQETGQRDGGTTIYSKILTKEWQELHKLHERGKAAGFKGTSAETLQLLNSLCANGVALRREPGTYPDKTGSGRWQAQSWRLK
jgi:hypothetical protein